MKAELGVFHRFHLPPVLGHIIQVAVRGPAAREWMVGGANWYSQGQCRKHRFYTAARHLSRWQVMLLVAGYGQLTGMGPNIIPSGSQRSPQVSFSGVPVPCALI